MMITMYKLRHAIIAVLLLLLLVVAANAQPGKLNENSGHYGKETKYHAVQVKVGGRKYDSIHEAERARELRLLERAGKIQGLREQVRFELVPAIYEVGQFDMMGDAIPLYDPPCLFQSAVARNEILEGGVPPVRPFRAPRIRETAESGTGNPSPTKRRKGRCVERSVEYVADFVYYKPDARGIMDELVVEDAKGVKTKDYVIKRKLMLWVYGIRVKEV